MRHQIFGRKLNRTSKQRKGLFKNLMLSLIQHGAIETTEAKAKSIRGLADTMIHRAQDNSMATARVLASFFGTREIVQKLMKEVAPAMKDRVSGFTRIIRLGRRQGDNSEMVRLELVQKPEVKVEKKVVPVLTKADAKAKAGVAPKTVAVGTKVVEAEPVVMKVATAKKAVKAAKK